MSRAIAFLVALSLAPSAVLAQIDPVQRTYLEAGLAAPVGDSGPVTGYSFLLWNRPHFHGPDNYARVILAPTYVRGEWIWDNLPGHGQAVGIGGEGGFFSQNYYDYRGGRYRGDRSFWGHTAGVAVSYFLHPYEIAGRLPVNIEFTVAPRYLAYQGRGGMEPGYRLPADTPDYTFRTGLSIGGVPPVLAPKQALAFAVWHEVRYRSNAGTFGTPDRPERTRNVTDRTWFHVGAILPVGDRQVFSLFFGMGVAGRTDPLSAFRLGGLQRFRSRFPLVLHGYDTDEIFATRYRLVNAFYRFPLLPDSRRVRLQLDADYAKVAYLPGHQEPRHDLLGLGTSLLVNISPASTLSVGFGYGVDAPRDHGFGSYTATVRFETKL